MFPKSIHYNFLNKKLHHYYYKYIFPRIEKAYYQNYFKNVKYPKTSKGNVLIFSGIGYMYITHVEILLYHLLRKEGYNVDYVILSDKIPINEHTTAKVSNGYGRERLIKETYSKAKRILDAARIDFQSVSVSENICKLLSAIDANNKEAIWNFGYHGVKFGEIVKRGLYRYYKSSNFGEDVIEVSKKYLITALSCFEKVRELCYQKRYDFVFLSHGIYPTWEPVVEFCKQKDIPFVCYDRGKRRGYVHFSLNKSAPTYYLDTAWERYKNKELSNEELQLVDEYLKERELQKNDVRSYNPAPKEKDLSVLKKRLGIAVGQKVITIFTNLIWDANNVARDIAFPSMLECIIETIKMYANRSDIKVLIRPHPAEKVVGTAERYGSLIKGYFQDTLPRNVEIVEPEMAINSFSIIELSDVAVVNTSTIGLEFAISEKPVLVIAQTHYRNKGFTHDINSSEEYFKKLEELLTNKTVLPKQKKIAKKYFYFMMFFFQKKIPAKYHKGYFNGYTKSFDKLAASSELSQVVQSLKKDGLQDFIFWD